MMRFAGIYELFKIKQDIGKILYTGYLTPLLSRENVHQRERPNAVSPILAGFFAVLGFELRAYTLSHSTSPF
jgi:hypothetical protein